MSLTLSQLQDVVNNIISDYKKVFVEGTEFEKARKAIGYHISKLKNYELERGFYPARSVTVLPKCSRMLDLHLIYNSEFGRIKYELTIRADEMNKFNIATNRITKFDESEELNQEPTIKKSPDLKRQNIRRTEKTAPPRTIPQIRQFVCPTKDKNCCYLQKGHNRSSCPRCCYDEKHIGI
jgi:hypothetical protein